MSEFKSDFLDAYKRNYRILPNTHTANCNSKYVDPVLFKFKLAQVKAELADHSQAINRVVESVLELQVPEPVRKYISKPSPEVSRRTLPFKRSAHLTTRDTLTKIQAKYTHIDTALSANKTLGLTPSVLPTAKTLGEEFSESWYIREHC